MCSVIEFPLGASVSSVKGFETRTAIEDGASEIDMVMNIGAPKSGLDGDVLEDIHVVANEAKPKRVLLKVIIEACYLTYEEKSESVT